MPSIPMSRFPMVRIYKPNGALWVAGRIPADLMFIPKGYKVVTVG